MLLGLVAGLAIYNGVQRRRRPLQPPLQPIQQI
jgi:hypothetical protein